MNVTIVKQDLLSRIQFLTIIRSDILNGVFKFLLTMSPKVKGFHTVVVLVKVFFRLPLAMLCQGDFF